LAGDLRVVNSNPGRNFWTIFDSGLKEKIQQKLPDRLKCEALMINFAVAKRSEVIGT